MYSWSLRCATKFTKFTIFLLKENRKDMKIIILSSSSPIFSSLPFLHKENRKDMKMMIVSSLSLIFSSPFPSHIFPSLLSLHKETREDMDIIILSSSSPIYSSLLSFEPFQERTQVAGAMAVAMRRASCIVTCHLGTTQYTYTRLHCSCTDEAARRGVEPRRVLGRWWGGCGVRVWNEGVARIEWEKYCGEGGGVAWGCW